MRNKRSSPAEQSSAGFCIAASRCDLLVAYVTRGTGGAAAALKKAVRSGKSFCLLDRGDLPE